MKLTQEQTDKILEKLKDYQMEIIDLESSSIKNGIAVISEEYFNEKVNEVLEDLQDEELAKIENNLFQQELEEEAEQNEVSK